MNLLADESVDRQIVERLRQDGHDVLYIAEVEPSISDDTVFDRANAKLALLVTGDKDFGEMVFRERREHHGIIFMRLEDERAANKIEVLRRLLENYAEKLPEQFVTVTETKVRFATT